MRQTGFLLFLTVGKSPTALLDHTLIGHYAAIYNVFLPGTEYTTLLR